MSGEGTARGRRRPPAGYWEHRLKITGALVVAVGIAMLIALGAPNFGTSERIAPFSANLAAAGAVLAFMLGALSYLQPARARASEIDRDAILDLIARTLEDHRIRSVGPAITLTSDERDVAVNAIVGQLSSDLVAAEVKKLEATMQTVAREKSHLFPFEIARSRLVRQSDALVRRGNLNLVIGMVMAGTGVYILGQGILAPAIIGSWDRMLSVYAPRLSLVLLIEVFAYFFLRLYKQSLDDGKYYQNELTNIELKLSAVTLSLDAQGEDLRAKVIEALIATERNFILEKGQSTVELERARLQNDAMAANLKELGALLRNGPAARAND